MASATTGLRNPRREPGSGAFGRGVPPRRRAARPCAWTTSPKPATRCWTVDPQPYRRTFFSLVTETDFTAGEVDRVTEKIVKPFCLATHPGGGQPRHAALHDRTRLPGLRRGAGSRLRPRARPAAPPAAGAGPGHGTGGRDPARPGRLASPVREAGTANIRLASSGRLLDTYLARVERPLIERLQRRLRRTGLTCRPVLRRGRICRMSHLPMSS